MLLIILGMVALTLLSRILSYVRELRNIFIFGTAYWTHVGEMKSFSDIYLFCRFVD